jgi:dolichol-phosphate mannosyltransferase
MRRILLDLAAGTIGEESPPRRAGLVTAFLSVAGLVCRLALSKRGPRPMPPVYSLVIPIYNEEAVLPLLLRRLDALIDALDAPAEAILVDDGSSDASPIVLEAKARADARYRFIRLSRNFGHQVAITTGMARAAGRAVIVMDADLQDPPEVVLDMVAKWKQGVQVVYAERLTRNGDSSFKRFTADLFYRLLAGLSEVEIPRNVGDFRLVDRHALDAFLAMPERDRFVRGMFAWIGFRQAVVKFHRPPRAAGETKYSLAKMLRLALSGVVSFSDAPLRLALWAGLTISSLAVLYGLWVIAMWTMNADFARGWSSIVVLVTFLGGANMLMTGVLGVYVGRIHAEVKRRPLYVVEREAGFAAQAGETAGRDEAAARRA